eukprot:scaffold38210_cov191-Amphora_coffeaeformis.AAC.5
MEGECRVYRQHNMTPDPFYSIGNRQANFLYFVKKPCTSSPHTKYYSSTFSKFLVSSEEAQY